MFQVTILMLTWTSIGKFAKEEVFVYEKNLNASLILIWLIFILIEHNYIQVLSAISSAFMMGKTAVEHHFHEMSAKTKIPKLTYMV